MLDLSDAVDSLKYMVARPGTFSDLYPETTDDMLLAVLCDAVGEIHLEALMLGKEVDEDGMADTHLTSGEVAMVVLFGAIRFIRAELLNRDTSVVYQAGPVRYEATQATNILRDILKGLLAQKDDIIDAGAAAGAGAAFYMADQYLARILCDGPVAIGW